ncbi:MAG TPA: diguanylate cyclase [Holophaga sp.]|nr:diguanylate cyclase [Holophaga sp.]
MNTSRHALLAVAQAPGTVDALKAILGDGHVVDRAGSLEEAIAQARQAAPGLMLVEAGTGDVAGFCVQLKNDPRTASIPVLLLASSLEEAIPAIEQGVNDFLPLPLEPATTRNRIRNYVDFGRCVEALRKYPLVDGVTGLATRHRFDDFLALEWRRCLRNRIQISIALMELDHFETYAEQVGAEAADACLRRVAEALQDAIQRPGDLMASYSRGRFAFVLPETDTLGAVSVAERLRAELASLAIPHTTQETAPILTMSVGTATRLPAEGSESEELVALAEHYLQEARLAGRNRVVFGS